MLWGVKVKNPTLIPPRKRFTHMHFCTDCGNPLPDSNHICHQCGTKAAAPEKKAGDTRPRQSRPPTPPKTARIHRISRCTTSLLNGTRPIWGKKMATPGRDSKPALIYRRRISSYRRKPDPENRPSFHFILPWPV